MLTVVLAAALVSCVAGDPVPDFVQRGKCCDVPIQDNFDLRKFAGRWYQTHAIPNPYEPSTHCQHAYFDYSESLYGFKVTSGGFDDKDNYLRMEFEVYPVKEFPKAHMLVDAPTMLAAPFEVVETDYETYSCVYSCISLEDFKGEFGFVFSRFPKTSGLAEKKCASVFNKHGLEFSKFEANNHTAECVYRA